MSKETSEIDRLKKKIAELEKLEIKYKEKTQLLQESEEKYRSLIENYPMILFRFDREHRYLFVSPAVEYIAKKPQSFFMGKKISDLGCPVDECQYWLEQGNKVFETGKAQEGIAQIKEPDGIRYIAWHMVPEFDEHGNVISVLSTERDITSIKRTENTLYHNLNQTRKLIAGFIRAIASMVETRDPYTAGHQRRVADFAGAIAQEMKLSEQEIEIIITASLIHDIGKISIPAEILTKPTLLSEAEYTIIKTHSQTGFNILKDIDFPWPIAQIVLNHHERINGSGYPNGLQRDMIPLESRIIGVADVLEAMAWDRPYRPSRGVQAAIEEIENNRNILYDIEVVDACLSAYKKNLLKFKTHK